MNSESLYYDIIDNALADEKLRITSKSQGDYFEKHHIVPRCLGGDNTKGNLVMLTPREHYLVHWLLYRIHKGSNSGYKMLKAWACMSGNLISTNTNSRRKYTSASYAYHKKDLSAMYSKQFTGEGNPFYGKSHTAETKAKIRKAHLGRKLNKPQWNTGIPHTEEVKEKMRNADRPTTVCEYCGEEVDLGNFKKSHGDNCKTLEINKFNGYTSCIYCKETLVTHGNITQFHSDNCWYSPKHIDYTKSIMEDIKSCKNGRGYSVKLFSDIFYSYRDLPDKFQAPNPRSLVRKILPLIVKESVDE